MAGLRTALNLYVQLRRSGRFEVNYTMRQNDITEGVPNLELNFSNGIVFLSDIGHERFCLLSEVEWVAKMRNTLECSCLTWSEAAALHLSDTLF